MKMQNKKTPYIRTLIYNLITFSYDYSPMYLKIMNVVSPVCEQTVRSFFFNSMSFDVSPHMGEFTLLRFMTARVKYKICRQLKINRTPPG